MVEPRGPWQTVGPTLAACPHHRGVCAYRVGDPERCDYCHASWSAIARWGQDRDGHLVEHTLMLERAAVANAARAATRAGNAPVG